MKDELRERSSRLKSCTAHYALLSSKTQRHVLVLQFAPPVQSHDRFLAVFNYDSCLTGLYSLRASFSDRNGEDDARPAPRKQLDHFTSHACSLFNCCHRICSFWYVWFTPILDLYRSHRAMHGNTPGKPSKTDPPPLVPPPTSISSAHETEETHQT